MTATTDRPQHTERPEADRLKGRNRVLTITVVVLAVALLGLGAWVIYDLTTESETTGNAEIEQLLSDYRSAVGENVGESLDPEASRAVTTDDFVLHEYTYRQFGDQFDAWYEPHPVHAVQGNLNWQWDPMQAPVIAGEGPWFLSVVENVTGTENRLVGTATYVIVDEGGTNQCLSPPVAPGWRFRSLRFPRFRVFLVAVSLPDEDVEFLDQYARARATHPDPPSSIEPSAFSGPPNLVATTRMLGRMVRNGRRRSLGQHGRRRICHRFARQAGSSPDQTSQTTRSTHWGHSASSDPTRPVQSPHPNTNPHATLSRAVTLPFATKG